MNLWGVNLDYKTLMERSNFGDILLVVWRELRKQVVKIKSKVDKARFQWLLLLLLYITTRNSVGHICNHFR
jgi:hypothetical protein